tara:strand:- start:1397 stop:1687 length:291 start_codon:yes stop_codon:yes gene_type:complete
MGKVPVTPQPLAGFLIKKEERKMVKPDLRHRVQRPDNALTKLQQELIKLGGKETCAYKAWEDIIEYITYLEAKLDRKNLNFRKMKKHIKELEEMTK